MRKCEICGANLDSGERCDCERDSDREKLDRAIGMIADAISTTPVADGMLMECGIVPCATLDYGYDITGEKRKEEQEPVGEKWKRAATIYRGVKITELQWEGEGSGF